MPINMILLIGPVTGPLPDAALKSYISIPQSNPEGRPGSSQPVSSTSLRPPAGKSSGSSHLGTANEAFGSLGMFHCMLYFAIIFS